MAINISNLNSVLTSKVAASSSSTAQVELTRQSILNDKLDSLVGADSYANTSYFPAVSNSNAGKVVYDSSSDTYYFSAPGADPSDSAWVAIEYGNWSFQGTNYGYTSGGSPTPVDHIVDKFPFASDANATAVGDLAHPTYYVAGQSSSTHAYTSGSRVSPYDNVQKMPFASDTDGATDVFNLSVGRYNLAAQTSEFYGYASGGQNPTLTPAQSNVIDKFPFAADTDAADVGDLTLGRDEPIGQNSAQYGYTSGGWAPPYNNTIDKFPFSTDANATDVGDLINNASKGAGCSSKTYGYVAGGRIPAGTDTIQKFSFTSDGNATDVANLTTTLGIYWNAGTSSTDYGYSSGGYIPGTGYSNVIDKFSFSSDADATDVGDLTGARRGPAGQQY